MKLSKNMVAAAFLVPMLLLAGCRHQVEDTGVFFDTEAYAAEKEMYDSSPLSSYDLTYEYFRGDAHPFNPDGQLERRGDDYRLTFGDVPEEESQWIPKQGSKYYVTSVEDLFLFTMESLKEESLFCARYPDRFRVDIMVTYDELYHFPRTIEICPQEVGVTEQPEGLWRTGIRVKDFKQFSYDEM